MMKFSLKGFNFKKFLLKNWSLLVIFGGLLFTAYMFEEGLGRWGLAGFIILTLVMGVVRLIMGWEQYKHVVIIGSNQLTIMKRLRDQERKAKKRNKEMFEGDKNE